MPRLLRDAPLNGIWEGSGNVMCSTSCGRWAASPRACPPSWPSASSPAAVTRGWTPPGRARGDARRAQRG